jgi:SAM-dependent methyltransferase
VCSVCGCRLTHTIANIQGYEYRACLGCGLAWLDPIPDDATLAACFDDGYFNGGQPGGYDDYERDAPLHRRNARKRLRFVERYASAGRLLDVGCARGYTLDVARESGWDVEGVEISPSIVAELEQRGIRVSKDLAEVAELEPGRFDVVTMYQFLAHVGPQREFIENAVECLRPGGLLVIETWDRTSVAARALRTHWHVLAPPSVVWLHSKASLELLMRDTGLEVVDYHRNTKWVSTGFVSSLLEEPQRGESLAKVGQLLERVPAAVGVPYGLGDLVTIVARKPD